MSDFRLKVVAETQAAERNLKQVGEVADKATKERKLNIKVPNIFEVTKTFQTLERDVKSAANTINTFYKVGKALPGSFGQTANSIENVGKGAVKSAIALNNNNTAAEIFNNTLKKASSSAGQLVTTLAKVGLATFAIKETVGILQAAFTGFFNNTIGREIKLRETILKTQTTLASTNKVFKNGKEITDPYQKIVTLTGAVKKNIDSIRERSIALAGVTSNEVIEVFGIVAGQIGQIGGGLKEAEDLAISFAAALGTFGLPIYQARQEIGSILRGDIGVDSILAKSLNISSKDIAEAKTKVGGVVKFLEERLAASVAGQKIAAQGFSGVVSNIKDLGELIGQNFGRGLLDPLLSGLTAVFETLFKIRTQIFAIATGAGETVGRVATLVTGLTAGRTGIGKGVDPSAAANAAQGLATKAFTEIESVAVRTVGAISQVIAALRPTALILADAFRNVVEAFVQIKVGSFQALASALANIATAAGAVAPAFATIFNLYARFLNTPIVKYFAEVSTVLALLKRAGLDAATSLLLFGKFIISSVIPALGVFGTAAGAVVAGIAAIGLAIGKLVLVLAGLASALVTPAAAIPAVAAAFQALSASLTNVGNQAVGANTKLANLGKGLTALGATAKAAGTALLASLGWVVAFQVGVAVVIDALGRFQRAQEEAASRKRALEALRRLETTYKDLGDNVDSATKSARDFERAIVDAEYNKGLARLEEIRQKIADIRNEMRPGIQNFGEFLLSLSQTANQRAALGRGEIANLEKERQRLQALNARVDAARDREQAVQDLKLTAQNRTNLEKEIKELRRSHESELFAQRQTLAQKEVEIFQAAGELRIRQMERANAKLIEGEEGASRVALEALNTYLVTKEQGEIEIESAKRTLAIETNNLEKAIADYRFETEKKIAEIRKRSADYEKDAADANARAAGSAGGGFIGPIPTGAAGPLSQLIGGVESYGGNYGAFNRGGSNQGHTAHGSGIDPNLVNMTIAEIQRRQLASGVPKNQQLHATGKYQIIGSTLKSLMAGAYGDTGVKSSDKYSPENQEKLFAALARNRIVPGNESATMQGLRQEWIGLQNVSDAKLRAATKVLMAGGGGSAIPTAAATPTAPADSAVGAVDPKQYETAVRGVLGAMARLRQLQEALINAKTVEAFENIAKSVFQSVELEQYQDQLYEVQLTYDAVAASSADAFNPERAKIAVEQATKIAASNRELGQIIEGINARSNISESKKKTLIEQVTARQKAFVASLKDEELARYRIQAVSNVTQVLQQIKQQTAAIYDQIEADKLRNRLEAEGESPERVSAELAKLALRKELNKAQEELTDLLEKEKTKRDEIAALLPGAKDAERTRIQAELDAALARIKELEQKQTDLPKAGAAAAAAIDAQAVPKTPAEIVQDRIGQLKREAAELTNVGNMTVKVADSIGSAFASSFKGVINGSMSARQALSSFFQSVADMFLEMAAQIIAKMITLAILNTIVGLLPGAGSSGGGFGAGGAGFGGSNAFGTFNAGGAQAFSMPSLMAEGGFVTGPTNAIIAEGAQPEYVIPANKMAAAMKRYGSGARGSSVIPSNGDSTEPATGTAAGIAIDVRYTVERINNVEYVTADQFREGMNQAARQGAMMGRNSVYSDFTNKRSVRQRMGL